MSSTPKSYNESANSSGNDRRELFVVIPTYWQGRTTRNPLPEDLVFDHPTFLDGEDTLSASLESLAKTESPKDFKVLVLSAAVHPSLEEEVIEVVDKIIGSYTNRLHIAHFHAKKLKEVQQRLVALGYPKEFLTLDGYASIRNCQLAIPAILGADVISAIDDDELVERDYPSKVLEHVGKPGMDGIAGRYRNKDGQTLVHDRFANTENPSLFQKKQAYQNEVYRRVEDSEDTITDTSIVLGGNMVFSRTLFMHVPFDPFVRRGEDIDYMINSMMAGFQWKCDKTLMIDHYPPACKETNKLQEDVMRFLYEKAKIEMSVTKEGIKAVRAEDLGPYPGNFLKENLQEEALQVLKDRPKEIEKEPWFLSAEEVIQKGLALGDRVDEFFTYLELWPNVVQALCSDAETKNILEMMF
ncbi:MAG: hypothetical protein RBR15_16400 [Sphaerochaeta sp.]|nr:hypothetical protein [Sphaerochaeta sp.]